jgi:hypothetical protein
MQRRRFIGAALAAGLAGCNQQRPATALEAIDFHIDWTPGVDYIGFFIAKERGTFENAGFDVTIVPGSGAEAAVELFTGGGISIGTTTVDAVLRAARSGQFEPAALPKIAAVMFQRNPVVLLSAASRPVTRVSELLGRRIGYSEETSVTYRQIVTLLRMQLPGAWDPDGPPPDLRRPVADDKVQLVRVDYDGPRRLVAGEVDTIVAYATDAPVTLAMQDYPFDLRYLSGFNLDMAGMCVCVRPAGFDDQAKAARLVDAACQGWLDTVADQEDALRTLTSRHPQIRMEMAERGLAQTLPLLPQRQAIEAYTSDEDVARAITRTNATLNQMDATQVALDPADFLFRR